MYMKTKYMSIILISSILGILLGFLIQDDIKNNELHISKDNVTIKEIDKAKNNIEELKKEKEVDEKELENLKNSLQNNPLIERLEQLSEKIGYTDIKMDGIKISIDAVDEQTGNIANMIEYNKVLLNIINDLKVNGAENISINEQRVNMYSEIILAGNHIHVNQIPIAPPYEITAAGKTDTLDLYIEDSNSYVNKISERYPLKVSTKQEKNLVFNKKSVTHEMNLIEGDKYNSK